MVSITVDDEGKVTQSGQVIGYVGEYGYRSIEFTSHPEILNATYYVTINDGESITALALTNSAYTFIEADGIMSSSKVLYAAFMAKTDDNTVKFLSEPFKLVVAKSVNYVPNE